MRNKKEAKMRKEKIRKRVEEIKKDFTYIDKLLEVLR